MTTQTQKENKNYYKGSLVVILAGVAFIFLLALGTWTDNRFGTHLVLSSDLSTAGEQGWFLWFVTAVGLGFIIFGIASLTSLNINESQDKSLTIAGMLLMGSAAFALALSSITFAAFNWQYFDQQIKNGTADAAYACIAIVVIATAFVIGFIIITLANGVNMHEKKYLTLRNTTMALMFLGWLVFNICIQSFGSMGGDANVLVAGLTGNDELLSNVGTFVSDPSNTPTGLEIFQHVTGKDKPGWSQFVWKGFISIWDNKIAGIFPSIGKDLIELGSGKEGLIMGVNNAMSSYSIFALTALTGFVFIPLYGMLSYKNTSAEKTSLVYRASLISIIGLTAIYLFLAATPYMPSEEATYFGGNATLNTLYLLLTGNYDPSWAPGLIALPGQEGGIHSAIVYFSDEYHGTTIWWVSEALTFIVPAIIFLSVMLTINKGNKEPKKVVGKKVSKKEAKKSKKEKTK